MTTDVVHASKCSCWRMKLLLKSCCSMEKGASGDECVDNDEGERACAIVRFVGGAGSRIG